MGLDMHLEGEKFFWTDWKNDSNNRKEDGLEVKNMRVKLGYWRKHPNLHGYIIQNFADGEDDYQEIHLSIEDMQQIITAIQNDRLPETAGFFFGTNDLDHERKSSIKTFTAAIAWLTTAEDRITRSIYYSASW